MKSKEAGNSNIAHGCSGNPDKWHPFVSEANRWDCPRPSRNGRFNLGNRRIFALDPLLGSLFRWKMDFVQNCPVCAPPNLGCGSHIFLYHHIPFSYPLNKFRWIDSLGSRADPIPTTVRTLGWRLVSSIRRPGRSQRICRSPRQETKNEHNAKSHPFHNNFSFLLL